MTRFEKIKVLSKEELIKSIKNIDSLNESILEWWSKKYCANCKSIAHKTKNPIKTNVPLTELYTYCEFYDKCLYFPNMNNIPVKTEIIEMWLNEEMED